MRPRPERHRFPDVLGHTLSLVVPKTQLARRLPGRTLAAAASEEVDPLSDRERQVLRLAGEGMKSADIAEKLHLSQGTVRNYLSEAIGKLGAENRIEAWRIARQRGLL